MVVNFNPPIVGWSLMMARWSALWLALDGPYLVLATQLPLLYIHAALLGPVGILLPYQI